MCDTLKLQLRGPKYKLKSDGINEIPMDLDLKCGLWSYEEVTSLIINKKPVSDTMLKNGKINKNKN